MKGKYGESIRASTNTVYQTIKCPLVLSLRQPAIAGIRRERSPRERLEERVPPLPRQVSLHRRSRRSPRQVHPLRTVVSPFPPSLEPPWRSTSSPASFSSPSRFRPLRIDSPHRNSTGPCESTLFSRPSSSATISTSSPPARPRPPRRWTVCRATRLWTACCTRV